MPFGETVTMSCKPLYNMMCQTLHSALFATQHRMPHVTPMGHFGVGATGLRSFMNETACRAIAISEVLGICTHESIP